MIDRYVQVSYICQGNEKNVDECMNDVHSMCVEGNVLDAVAIECGG